MATTPTDPTPSRAAASTTRPAPDYFGRLAQQAVQSSDRSTLVPRIASRFEPGSAGDSRSEAGLREVEAWLESNAASESVSGGKAAPEPRSPSRARADQRDGFRPRAPIRPNAAMPAVESAGPNPDMPTVQATFIELQPQAVQHADPQGDTQGERRPPQGDSADQPRTPTDRDESKDKGANVRAVASTAVVAQAPALGPIERLDPSPVSRLLAAPLDAPAPASRERGVPAHEASKGRNGRPLPVAPSPVEIHIDRIEVHGITPSVLPAPAYPTAAPARPATGLDELLRHRRGAPA